MPSYSPLPACLPRQAADFASDDHVDVVVRQQLAQLLFDNAEMRKQLNAYTEGILTQTMERLETKKENGGGGMFGMDGVGNGLSGLGSGMGLGGVGNGLSGLGNGVGGSFSGFGESFGFGGGTKEGSVPAAESATGDTRL